MCKPETRYETKWDNRYFEIGTKNIKRTPMSFDWQKAATLIKEFCPNIALAGLNGDWDHSVKTIWANGKPIKFTRGKLRSTWAIPSIFLNDTLYECFTFNETVSVWPKSALEALV